MNRGMQESDGAVTDAELVRRARDGDQAAFRSLVLRYEPLVAGTVVGMLGRGADAEDVGQETFVRFWRALDSFRGDASVGTYLTRIAMNGSLNRIRQRSRFFARFAGEVPEDLPDLRSQPDNLLDQKERSAFVDRAIRALKPELRAVVVLRLVQGMSTRETAEALSIPVGTVLSRLSRAEARLRSRLSPLLDRPA